MADKWTEAEKHFADLLTAVGYPPSSSEHLQETPRRFLGMLREFCTEEPWSFTKFPASHAEPGQQGDSGIVVLRSLPFESLCAHHFAPFFGVAHVAYIPNQWLAGVSKIARAVKHWAKGPNVQEQITANVADYLTEQLEPLGVMVILDAEHTCMTLRGVKAHGARTTTSAVRGVFFTDPRARQEALELIKFGG